MITAALRQACDHLETIRVPGPWPGPAGESWELELRPFAGDAFQRAMEAAGVTPRSYADRIRDLEVPSVAIADLVMKSASGTKKARRRLEAEATVREEEHAAAELVAEGERRKLRREGVEVGYDVARYPDVVLTLAEVAKVRDAVTEHLVAGAWSISAAGDRAEVDAEEWAAWFASDEALPLAVEVAGEREDEDDERDVQALYLGGRPEGVALATWCVRHAAQEHRFWEARVPLGSTSGSPPPKSPTGRPRKASGKSKGPS